MAESQGYFHVLPVILVPLVALGLKKYNNFIFQRPSHIVSLISMNYK